MLTFQLTTAGELISECGKYLVRKDVSGRRNNYVAIISNRICHHGSKKRCIAHCQTVAMVYATTK